MATSSTIQLSTYPGDHDRAFPFFREPNILGFFSLDGERRFSKDFSGIVLKHISLENFPLFSGLSYSFQRDNSSVSLNLDYNVNRAIKPTPMKENEAITNLLKGILEFKHTLAVKGELDSLHTDVVCFRF